MAFDDDKLWAALLGYCGDPRLAADHLDADLPPTEAFARAIEQIDQVSNDSPSIIDLSSVGGDYSEIRSAIETLAEMPAVLRAETIYSRLFAPPDLTREPLGPDELDRALSVLMCTSPPLQPVRQRISPAVIGVGALTALGVVVSALVSAAGLSDSGQLDLAATTTTTEQLNAPIPVRPIDLETLVADADRVVDVVLTADGFVVRRDGETAEIIWTSRQYRDATDVRVDADVVTVARTSGWITYLSLTDGTQLPP